MDSVKLIQSNLFALNLYGVLGLVVSEQLKYIQEILDEIGLSNSLFDRELNVEGIALECAGSSAKVAVAKFSVAGFFLTKDGDLLRFRMPGEIEGDLAAIAAAAGRQATTVLKERVLSAIALIRHESDRLIKSFAAIDVDLTAHGFFGVSGVTGTGRAQAAVALDGRVIADLLRGGETTKPLLKGTFRGDLVLAKGGDPAVRGSIELVVVIKLDKLEGPLPVDLISLLTAIRLPQVNKVPFPKLQLPTILIPRLAIPDIDFGPIEGLLDFAFRAPWIDSTPNIRVGWDKPESEPKLTMKVGSDTGALFIETTQPGYGTILYNGKGLGRIDGFSVVLGKAGLELSGTITPKAITHESDIPIDLGAISESFPFELDLPRINVEVSLANAAIDLANPASPTFDATVTIDVPRLVIRAKGDPGSALAIGATYAVSMDASGKPNGKLTRLEVLEPYPVRLIGAIAEDALDGVVRLISVLKLAPGLELPGIPLPDVGPVLDRIGQLLASALKWVARQASTAGDVLAGIAEEILAGLAGILDILRNAADKALSHVALEVRLDSQSFALRQIIITPVNVGTAFGNSKKTLTFGGFSLSVPGAWKPSVVLDFSGPLFAALVVQPSSAELELSTDLWLDRAGAPAESVRGNALNESGAKPEPLISLLASGAKTLNIALISLDDGVLRLFKVLVAPPGEHPIDVAGKQMTISAVGARPVLRDIDAGDDGDLKIEVKFAKDAATTAQRYLPFLGSPGTEGDSGNPLSQYVTVEASSSAKVTGTRAILPVKAVIHLDDMKIDADLELSFDVARLTAKISGGDTLVIRGKRRTGSFLGLTYDIKPKSAAAGSGNEPFAQFRLDLSGGNPRLVLHEDAEVELTYPRLGTDGRGLRFKVQEFAVAKGSFDVVAVVDSTRPVVLPGVNMPFRFSDGKLVIRRGRIEGFSLTGAGQLPPELVGEANCRIALMLGRDADGDLAVLSADAELDKSDEPIECHGTRFSLSISKLGFAFEDFGSEGGYQFYFLVTGTIAFSPKGSEFGTTFLKNLRNVKMTLTKAPLGRDMRLLLRAIDLQVTLDPKVNINLFDIFEFELRSFGFYPAAEAFDGSPALSIGGQAKFTDIGDVVSAKIDFHKMWIAPPKNGPMPRVRFDGLGVSLSLKGAGTIEGTAITVDDQLPSLYKPDTLPPGISAQGFLASGHLRLEGWGSMGAAMGFLELQGNDGTKRSSFFLYGEAKELSEPIPTPIKEIYLREVGFGFGYRYTLAGLRRADSVSTPQDLVEVLDDVSRYQNDLAKFQAWEPETVGNRITLALRGMLSVNSASQSGSLSEAEKKLPNPLLFDVAAALRSDLTFLMTARAWPSVNYYTWARGPNREEISSKPMLRGYLYISAPRQELLARLIADPTGYIGETPKLPEPVVRALRSVRWSSTIYVRPGLFHIEYGWPYELEIKLGDSPNFGLTLQGGAVFRIEDASLLYGIAFRAQGFAQFGGSIGGDSLGASVEARADFSLDGKFIAYVSLDRASDTLFYGSLAFACTVLFRVRFWLRFKVGFIKVSLSISFSVSLSISIALEAAVGPDILAGRGSARIAVSAFGRTLSLGVGFGFNEGRLEEARARVARFLSLGLAASVPDPAQGLAAPQPAAPPAKDDRRLDAEAKKDGVLGEVDAGPPPTQGDITVKPPCQVIGAPEFLALLFELPAQPGSYVMQLVPRDRTASAALAKTSDGGGAYRAALAAIGSTFYAPPKIVDGGPDNAVAYKISVPAGMDLIQLTGEADTPERKLTGTQDLTVFGKRPVATDDGQSLLFGDFLEQCFVRETMVFSQAGELRSSTEPLMEPAAEVIDAGQSRYSDRSLHEKALREAASHAAKLSRGRAENRAAEERRSALIAAVCESAANIAGAAVVAAGKVTWPSRQAPAAGRSVIDARDTGLTFFVRERVAGQALADDTLAGLFDAKELQSKFTISTVLAHGAADSGHRPVRLQNPPTSHFDNLNPTLDDLAVTYDKSGISLNWDLNARGSVRGDVLSDPEFKLKHYRIQRTFRDHNGVVASIPVFETTTKAASPLRAELDGDNIEWQHVPVVAQFVDDFADLPAAWRQALLDNGAGQTLAVSRGQAGKDAGAVKASWDDFTRKAAISSQITLAYLIVPVDTGGNEGVGTPFEYSIERVAPAPVPIGNASLRVAYDSLPGVPGAGKGIKIELRVDDALFAVSGDKQAIAGASHARLPHDGTIYRLLIRPERSAVIGLFGVDSVGEALSRPSPQALEEGEGFSVTVDLKLTWQSQIDDVGTYAFDHGQSFVEIGTAPKPLAPVFVASVADLNRLREALGLDANGAQKHPRSVRAAIRRISAPNDGGESPYAAADMLMRIGKGELKLGQRLPAPVDTVVEVFESPRVIGYKPLEFGDLAGSAGRLLINYPMTSSLKTLLDDGKVKRIQDADGRVATKLKWNAVPSPEGNEKIGPEQVFVAGHDLFEIDLTATTRAEEQAEVATNIGRIMMLDPRLANALPEAIVDFGAVEAYYPSERRRLDRAPPGIRRRAWFSPSESLSSWPKPLVRRSIGLGANDVDLAALIVKGTPARILVEWHNPEMPVEPFGNSLKRLEALCGPGPAPVFRTQKLENQPEKGFEIVGGTSQSIRALLFDLEIVVPSALQGAYELGNALEAFTNLEIKLTGRRATGHDTGSLLLKVDLHQATHAFIADVIDALRWHDTRKPEDTDKEDIAGETEEFYRRYRPVLEPPPQTEAKSLAALLDERPVGRDRYGWAILKTLGLAQGFRLFDLRAGEFADPKAALCRLRKTVDTILPRYHGEFLGAPMVDILMRPSSLHDVSSFDGGTTATVDFDGRGVLPLIQLALRPMAENLVKDPKPDVAPVRYFRVDLKRPGKHSPVPMTDCVAHLKLDGTMLGADYIVEVIDISLNLSGGRVRAFAKGPTSYATRRLSAGRLVEPSATFPVRLTGHSHGLMGESKSRSALLLRVVGPKLCKAKEEIEGALSIAKVEGSSEAITIKVDDVPKPNALLPLKPADPFSRFPELDGKTISSLFFGSKEADEGGSGTNSLPASETAAEQMKRITWYATMRFGAGSDLAKMTAAQKDAFGARWPAVIRRFLEHGLEDAPADSGIAYSFATIPMPDPMRLAIPDDGVLETVIIHKDLLAKRLRYVVRPFGRYENIMAAWHAAQSQEKLKIPFASRRLLRDSIGADDSVKLPQISADELRDYSIDIIVPRTQPLAPPVVLSARRLDVLPEIEHGPQPTDADGRPGRLLEFVVARHGEEIVSESNAMTADGLQFEHTAFGFSRQFAHASWLESLRENARAIEGDWDATPTPYAASGHSLPPPALSFKGSEMTEVEELDEIKEEAKKESPEKPTLMRKSLPSRLTDGWRGITAMRIQGVPHFYRVHASIFAAAGVVVSKSVAAVIPEGHHELHWPWWNGGEEGGTPKGFDKRRPTWCVTRNDKGVWVQFEMPLVRLVDGMPVQDRELWMPKDAKEERIFLLPDPGIAYEISLRRHVQAASDLTIPVDVSPEIEFLSLPAERCATYLAKNLGHALKVDNSALAVKVKYAKENLWSLPVIAEVIPASTPSLSKASPIPDRLLSIAGELQIVGDNPPPYQPDVCAVLWADFAVYAPTASAVVNIFRPVDPVLGWGAFQNDIVVVRDWAQAYADKSQGKMKAELLQFIDGLKPYLGVNSIVAWLAQVGGTPPLGHTDVQLEARLPAGMCDLPSLTHVRLGPAHDWTVEAIATKVDNAKLMRFRLSLRDLRVRGGSPLKVDEVETAFAKPYWASVWSLMQNDQARNDRRDHAGFAPIAETLPEEHRELAAAVADKTPNDVFQFLAPVVIHVRADVRTEPAFVALLEVFNDDRLGNFPLRASLSMIEWHGNGRISAQVPWCEIQSAKPLAIALAALDAIDGVAVSLGKLPESIMLRKPPTDNEMDDLKAKYGAGEGPLFRLICRLAERQLFGAERRPYLKALKGMLEPILVAMHRKTGI